MSRAWYGGEENKLFIFIYWYLSVKYTSITFYYDWFLGNYLFIGVSAAQMKELMQRAYQTIENTSYFCLIICLSFPFLFLEGYNL